MPRGLHHLIGLIFRSFEVDIPIGVHHLQNLLEICPASMKSLRYYLSNKKEQRIICDFPSKDNGWENYFFFVLITGATVGEEVHKFVRKEWQPIGSRNEGTYSLIFSHCRLIFPFVICFTVRRLVLRFPDNLLTIRDLFREGKVSWKEDFSYERVENARAQSFDSFDDSDISDESSSKSVVKMEEKSIRRVKAKERKRKEPEAEAARSKAEGKKEKRPSPQKKDSRNGVSKSVTEVVAWAKEAMKKEKATTGKSSSKAVSPTGLLCHLW